MRIEYGHKILRLELKSSADPRLLLEGPDHVTVVKIKIGLGSSSDKACF